ncbi:MAG: hypothetical protein U1E86_17705 [Burkholderiaceae bacterium]
MNDVLWAVASYFNPSGSRRRLANYRVFRERLGVPLLTVEWSREGGYELGPGDADQLVQVRGGDLMWQKERLLNLAVDRLPADCDVVAWLDCDVVFGRADWPREAVARLGSAAMVQIYDEVVYLAREPFDALVRPGPLDRRPVRHVRRGLMGERQPPLSEARFGQSNDDVSYFVAKPSVGFAWAARRDFLRRHPLFDRCVIGGGDSAYTMSAVGQFERLAARHRYTRAQRDFLAPLAARLADEVGTRIDAVPGRLFHLWHGELEHRRYGSRYDVLRDFAFDPARGLALDRDGVWSWSDVAPGLPQAVRAYFAGRLEDGVPAEPAAEVAGRRSALA